MPINKKSHQAPEMTAQSPECRQHYYAVMSHSVSASGTGTSITAANVLAVTSCHELAATELWIVLPLYVVYSLQEMFDVT